MSNRLAVIKIAIRVYIFVRNCQRRIERNKWKRKEEVVKRRKREILAPNYTELLLSVIGPYLPSL